MMLALGVAGLALFSIFGKSKRMARLRDEKGTRKDLTSWEGEGGNSPSKTSAATTPPASTTSH